MTRRRPRDWAGLIETIAWVSLLLPVLLVVAIALATAYHTLLP